MLTEKKQAYYVDHIYTIIKNNLPESLFSDRSGGQRAFEDTDVAADGRPPSQEAVQRRIPTKTQAPHSTANGSKEMGPLRHSII